MMPCNFYHEIDQYLKREEEQQMRQEELEARIEEQVKDLMQDGESCDPYGITIHKGIDCVYYNLFEALNEIPEVEQRKISDAWRDAAERTDMFMVKREAVFARLDKLVREYWMKCAKHQAEKEL